MESFNPVREGGVLVQTPQASSTHRVGFRHIGIVKEQYAVDRTGQKMWGTLDLDTGFHGCRFPIAMRNSHDKSMRLAMTVGYRVLACDNGAFSGDYQPVLAKHSTASI